MEKVRKLTEEHKRKLSEANKGKHHLSEEARKKLSESHKGKTTWNKGLHLSEEHKRKLSEVRKERLASGKIKVWNKGEKGVFSEEVRRKHSDFMKNYYQSHRHPMLGKKQSEESIRKSVESRNRTLLDPNVRKRLGNSHRGQIAWNKGKLMSKEMRQKLCRLTITDMQEIAKSRGGECLSNEYISSSKNLQWKCKEGHTWEASPHNIKRDKWCPICSIRVSEKICRGYFEAFFQEKFPKAHPNWMKNSTGKNLELDGYCKKLGLAFEYQGVQHYLPTSFFNKKYNLEKIKQHDEFKKERCIQNKVALIQVPHNISYEQLGKWIEEECKKEGFKPLVNAEKINYKTFDVYSSRSLEEMREIAKNFGGNCLSDRYINGGTKLKWQCKNGHIWEARPRDVKRGTWCPLCSFERARNDWKNQSGTASEFQKSELNNLRDLARIKQGECLSDKYINSSTGLRWKCKEGHIWEARPGNIKSGKWCPKCAYKLKASLRRGNIKDMQEIAKGRGGKCLSDKYVNVDSRLRWRCSKGHEWEAIPSSIKGGSWCPICAIKRRSFKE